MYVEDDADTRELVSLVLARAGYEVVVADNPEQAARLAQTASFDLYLIDNWMPGTSGIELCRKLREYEAQTPILFYLGAAQEQDKRAAFAVGAQGYLTKPVSIDELLIEISGLISEFRSARLAADLAGEIVI